MVNWQLIITISFLMTVITLPFFIRLIKKYKIGQRIRLEGPDLHQHKMGTPTMGGVIIMIVLLLMVTFFVPHHQYIFYSLMITIGFGLIGLLDDLIKYLKKRSMGLTTSAKLFYQIIFSLLIAYCIQKYSGIDKNIYLSIAKSSLDLGSLYIPMIVLVLISSVNAVNLTDGLDGLATGLIFIAMISFSIIAILQDLWSIGIFSLIVASISLGFLIYNIFPAKIFLGDSGSFALGGALASVAIFTKTELLLVIIGGVFAIETLSVIIQVSSVKIRKKTVFKMSPIHHHFEMSGWKGPKIVVFFWITGVVLGMIGLLIYYQ